MTAWKQTLIERLAANPIAGYAVDQSPATEVVALTALALAANGYPEQARVATQWLVETQSAEGSLSARASLATPRWTTSLAILAWQAVGESSSHAFYEENIASAVRWLLEIKGTTMPKGGFSEHDTTLAGWPWVDGTHSWVEPTAWAVLALCAVGLAEHPRTREATRLLVDRLLPAGGCNYGNTVVLGQTLRPHVEPTGLAMLALAGAKSTDARIPRSLEYLTSELRPRQGLASLCFATLALAAHERLPLGSERHLEAAATRTLARDASPYKLALLALAAMSADSPLIPLERTHAGSRF